MAKLKAVLLSCTSLLLFPSLVRADELQLHQLNVIFRHGDRMPETFPKRIPNDPNMHDTFHPMGSGGLTNEGKRRMYRLGELLRERHASLLGSEYAESKLFAISSSLSRTKMSLQLVLAALYPPSLLAKESRWHESLDWQPIPAYYHDFKHDRFFGRDKCEMFIEEWARVYNSSEVQKKMDEFRPFFEHLRVVTGKEDPITLDDILILHNNLDIEKRLNMTMEPWMVDTLQDPRLKAIRMFYYKLNGYNEKLRRLQAGFFVRLINEDMIKASNKTLSYPRKVALYSGHDKNLIAMFQLLKIFDLHLPEFGSALIFELLSKNNQYYVRILYHLGIPEEIKTLTLPGCESLCPLNQYLNLTKFAEPLDDEMKCKIKLNSYFGDEN